MKQEHDLMEHNDLPPTHSKPQRKPLVAGLTKRGWWIFGIIVALVIIGGTGSHEATSTATVAPSEPVASTEPVEPSPVSESAKPREPMLLRFFLQCGMTDLNETMWGCYTGHGFAVWAPDNLASDTHGTLIRLMREHKNYDPQTDSIFEVDNPERGVLWLHGREFLAKARTLANPVDVWGATIVDTDTL